MGRDDAVAGAGDEVTDFAFKREAAALENGDVFAEGFHFSE